jgi:hypothetical protein
MALGALLGKSAGKMRGINAGIEIFLMTGIAIS